MGFFMYICFMKYGEKIMNRIKSSLYDFHKLLSIEKYDDLNHIVWYIKISFYNNEPSFIVDYAYFDFKVELREDRINMLLTLDKSEIDSFDVENIIYTEDQQERLNNLRNIKLSNSNFQKELRSVKIDYSKSFKVGEPVYFNGHNGIITFKHNTDKDLQLWSVKIGETEHRYIKGIYLRKRKVEDLSDIEIDEKLNKLSTERLLKMYKAGMKRNNGIGNKSIKRILNEREHIKKGESKTIIHPH